MKLKYLAIPLPLILGLIVGFLFSARSDWYQNLVKPSFNPPAWLFGPVWTILYILMGISLYLVLTHKLQVKLFIAQLILNLIWTPIFFGVHYLLLSVIVIIALLISVIITIYYFYKVNKTSAYLLIPYLVWLCIATTLNISILILNA